MQSPMRSLRALRTVAACAVALSVSLLPGALVTAGPDGPSSKGGLLDLVLGSLINQVGGDDAFSTANIAPLMTSPGTPTQHYGPYPSGSPDSGTCGNDWAMDTFDREFVVRSNGDGTFTIVEQ